MDFALYTRVVWRFRYLVLAGVVLSVLLAVLSYGRVGLDGPRPTVTPRGGETWQSTALLQVSQKGFPPGVSVLNDPASAQPEKPREGPIYSEPARFQDLAILYSKFAESDEVKELVRAKGPENGTYFAQPVKTDDGAYYLPFVMITATSGSAASSQDLAGRVTNGLRSYIEREQNVNQIPAERRVELLVVNEAQEATLLAGPSIVKPMFVLLIGLAATFGLAFVLENVRPRARPARPQAAALHVGSERRTA